MIAAAYLSSDKDAAFRHEVHEALCTAPREAIRVLADMSVPAIRRRFNLAGREARVFRRAARDYIISGWEFEDAGQEGE